MLIRTTVVTATRTIVLNAPKSARELIFSREVGRIGVASLLLFLFSPYEGYRYDYLPMMESGAWVVYITSPPGVSSGESV